MNLKEKEQMDLAIKASLGKTQSQKKENILKFANEIAELFRKKRECIV